MVDAWVKNQITKIHQAAGLKGKLKKLFEEIDSMNTGFVELADFKMVIYKNVPEMSVDDVHRFTRIAEKDVDQRVKYYEFLKFLDDNAEMDNGVSSRFSESSKYITQRLASYLQ